MCVRVWHACLGHLFFVSYRLCIDVYFVVWERDDDLLVFVLSGLRTVFD